MFQFAKRTLVLATVAALLILPLGTNATAQEYFESEDPGGGEMLFDFVFVRPVGIVATVIGSIAFVISLPFSALGDNVDVAGQKLVKEPAAYTFTRPIGEFRQGIR